MKILLPDKLELTCTHCRETFKVKSSSTHNKAEITCPFCAKMSNLSDCLPTRVRRQIYHALRDEFEQRVYSKHRELYPESPDQWLETTDNS